MHSISGLGTHLTRLAMAGLARTPLLLRIRALATVCFHLKFFVGSLIAAHSIVSHIIGHRNLLHGTQTCESARIVAVRTYADGPKARCSMYGSTGTTVASMGRFSIKARTSRRSSGGSWMILHEPSEGGIHGLALRAPPIFMVRIRSQSRHLIVARDHVAQPQSGSPPSRKP